MTFLYKIFSRKLTYLETEFLKISSQLNICSTSEKAKFAEGLAWAIYVLQLRVEKGDKLSDVAKKFKLWQSGGPADGPMHLNTEALIYRLSHWEIQRQAIFLTYMYLWSLKKNKKENIRFNKRVERLIKHSLSPYPYIDVSFSSLYVTTLRRKTETYYNKWPRTYSHWHGFITSSDDKVKWESIHASYSSSDVNFKCPYCSNAIQINYEWFCSNSTCGRCGSRLAVDHKNARLRRTFSEAKTFLSVKVDTTDLGADIEFDCPICKKVSYTHVSYQLSSLILCCLSGSLDTSTKIFTIYLTDSFGAPILIDDSFIGPPPFLV